jgi:hypothetical protein
VRSGSTTSKLPPRPKRLRRDAVPCRAAYDADRVGWRFTPPPSSA